MPQEGRAPEIWQKGKRCYCTGLTLDIAKKMLEAGEKEAIKQEVPMAMAVVDSGGILVAFYAMDNVLRASIQIAMDKAFTSVMGKQPTWKWGHEYKQGVLVPLYFHERWITFPGGFPILKNGQLMGGFGVSGGIAEDIYVARAALKAGGFSLEEVNEYMDHFFPDGHDQ
jgi:uncharacterized protein GlcG (DUF336 family)